MRFKSEHSRRTVPPVVVGCYKYRAHLEEEWTFSTPIHHPPPVLKQARQFLTHRLIRHWSINIPRAEAFNMPDYLPLTSLGPHGVSMSRAMEGAISQEALPPGEETRCRTSDKEAISIAYPGTIHYNRSEPMIRTMATHWFCCQW